MRYTDVQRRLANPFPVHAIQWKPHMIAQDRKRALLVAYLEAHDVTTRLENTVPNDWAFQFDVIAGTPTPTVKGRLSVLGLTREDIGEGSTLKTATEDALKRCAVHFGIGRYLFDLPLSWADWDDERQEPHRLPEIPEWARPESERTPGGAHLVQALEQLRQEMPSDMVAQREIYKHLRAALSVAHAETA